MLSKILNQLNQLSSEELKTLNKAVVAAAKAKDSIESVVKGASLKIGQEVLVDHPTYKGMKFTITKVNRTRCKISGHGGAFNCPINMIIA